MDSGENFTYVLGYVKSINITAKLLVVNDTLTNKLFTCKFDGFLPASESDAIAGILINQNGTYTFLKKPLVKLTNTKETITHTICKALNFKIKPNLANKIYDNLLVDGKGLTVDESLNNMAVELHDKQIESFSKLPDFLDANQILKLLRYWYKSRTLRQLYLLGLNNQEITKCEEITGFSPTRIYQECLINPFKMIPIPIDKCKVIFECMCKEYTEEELYHATIARKIYSNTLDKGWVGTPTHQVQDSFKNVDYKKLKEDYELEAEFHTLYLPHHYKVEKTVAEVLYNMKKLNSSEIKIIPQFNDIRLTNVQKAAVTLALNAKICCITGEAGSGKTTIVKEIVSNLKLNKVEYICGAFTGKAVARLKEVLNEQSAMTLNMMIARRQQIQPFKVLIIDEAPIAPTELIYYIFKSFGTEFQLCLIGDDNQLPPVSWGNFFSEVLASTIIPTINLPQSHRCKVEDDKNDINYNSRKLIENYKTRKEGKFTSSMQFRTGNNFFRIEGDIQAVLDLVTMFFNQGVESTRIIIITPYTKCLDDINRGIQKIYNSDRKYIVDDRGKNWTIGDKVMITSNSYNLGLMNGDEGIITDMNEMPGKSGYRELMIEFKSGLKYKFDVTYDPEDLNVEIRGDSYTISNNPTLSLLTHSYAITVHKSQGSEYDFVIAYMPKNDKDSTFINFNLIYTWFTRPKTSLFVVGDLQSIDLNCTREAPFRVDNLGKRMLNLQKMDEMRTASILTNEMEKLNV
jgi:hypothetical protein